MEKLVVFLDYANIHRAAQTQGWPIDYGHLLGYLAEGRFLVEAHAFVPRDPRATTAMDRSVETLWSEGWLVHDKVGTLAGPHYKCDFDVEITLEVMRTAELVHPDIILLLTGDGDFVPLVLEARRRGIRVEVAAFVENTARELMLRCSGFIDLGAWLSGDSEATDEKDLDNDEPADFDQTEGQEFEDAGAFEPAAREADEPNLGRAGRPLPTANRYHP